MRRPKGLVKKSAKVALLTGAMLFACSNVAQAAQTTNGGGGGLLSDNNVAVPVTVPINVCGLGIGAVLGIGNANAHCTNVVEQEPVPDQVSNNNAGGLLGGNNVAVPVTVPINVCGAGIGVAGIGVGNADCVNVIKPPSEHKPPHEKPKPPHHHKPCKRCEHPKPEKPEHPKPVTPPKPTPLRPAEHQLAVTGVPAEAELGVGLSLVVLGGIIAFAGRRRFAH